MTSPVFRINKVRNRNNDPFNPGDSRPNPLSYRATDISQDDCAKCVLVMNGGQQIYLYLVLPFPHMTLRIDHVIVVFATVAFLLLAMLFLSMARSYRWVERFHSSDAKLNEIRFHYEQHNLPKAIELADQLLNSPISQPTEMRASCYLGLAKIELGKLSEARSILNELLNKYDLLNSLYRDEYNLGPAEITTPLVFKIILTDFLPDFEKMMTEPATLSSIISGLGPLGATGLISACGSVLRAYERIRKRRNAKVSRELNG